jgi:hypothetical protein
MARFYATFDNSTNNSLEASYYGRIVMNNGSTIKSNLLSTRDSLSSAVYAQMNSGNISGSTGVVVPGDVVTRSGGNYSWSNLFTNSAAIWPANPAVRPTQQILSENSTPVQPSDDGTFSDSTYVSAQSAVEAALTACANGGPRARLGVNPFRTLASLHHDHDMTYIAWDDYTPGQPGSAEINVTSTNVIISWTVANNYEFPADVLADVSVSYSGTIAGQNASGSVTLAPGSSQAQIAHGITAPNGSSYSITANITFSYSSPFSASGTPRTISKTDVVGTQA